MSSKFFCKEPKLFGELELHLYKISVANVSCSIKWVPVARVGISGFTSPTSARACVLNDSGGLNHFLSASCVCSVYFIPGHIHSLPCPFVLARVETRPGTESNEHHSTMIGDHRTSPNFNIKETRQEKKKKKCFETYNFTKTL